MEMITFMNGITELDNTPICMDHLGSDPVREEGPIDNWVTGEPIGRLQREWEDGPPQQDNRETIHFGGSQVNIFVPPQAGQGGRYER